jgi:hypothetical protein
MRRKLSCPDGRICRKRQEMDAALVPRGAIKQELHELQMKRERNTALDLFFLANEAAFSIWGYARMLLYQSMAEQPVLKTAWEYVDEPNSDELLYQAYQIILGDEIGPIEKG